MPVLVNPKVCVDREQCFAAGACPNGAFYHNPLKKTWEVDAALCGECPGPCLNFCDKDALRWGDDLVDLKLVKAELQGTMTTVQVAEARLKHKKELEDAAQAAQKESAEGVIELTRANFEREVLMSQVPVVVDCWAAWCAPCKQFSPVFESLAKQYVGVVKFAKLDTDAEQALAGGLGVRALPTTLMFYKGQLVDGVEGALPAQQFQAWIYQTLAEIRQHEAQFAAEAETALGAASQNLTALDGEAGAAPPSHAAAASSGYILDQDSPAGQSNRRDPSPQPDPPGKQTASGLYIP